MSMSATMIQCRVDRRSKRAELPDDIAKKLKSCSVHNCEEWRDLTAYTTYHCFPTGEKNQERWEIWTHLIRKAREDEQWIPFRGSLICSHHFRSQDFINDPLSKRRKLTKTAIPSVFPTFTVDLENPEYALTNNQDDVNEDSYEGAESGGENTHDETENLLNTTGEYEYEYPGDDEPAQQDEEMRTDTPAVVEEEDDDDDIQIISGPDTPSPKLTHTSYFIPRKNATEFMNKSGTGKIHIVSTASLPQQQQRNIFVIPASKLSQIRNSSNLVTTQANLQSRSVTSSSNNPRQLQRLILPATNQKSVPRQKLSAAEETAKAISSLPFSLNPDLEIDIIDPAEELAVCRQRITELEQENKSLRDTYENALEEQTQHHEHEVMMLRKRIIHQQRIIAAQNQNQTSPKKARLS